MEPTLIVLDIEEYWQNDLVKDREKVCKGMYGKPDHCSHRGCLKIKPMLLEVVLQEHDTKRMVCG